MTPQQWVAAANMVQRRGEKIQLRQILAPAWILQLPDGTQLSYTDGTATRHFRSADQARATFARFGLDQSGLILLGS